MKQRVKIGASTALLGLWLAAGVWFGACLMPAGGHGAHKMAHSHTAHDALAAPAAASFGDATSPTLGYAAGVPMFSTTIPAQNCPLELCLQTGASPALNLTSLQTASVTKLLPPLMAWAAPSLALHLLPHHPPTYSTPPASFLTPLASRTVLRI